MRSITDTKCVGMNGRETEVDMDHTQPTGMNNKPFLYIWIYVVRFLVA